jgi:hypothetical protein
LAPQDIDKAVWFLFPRILVLVLLPILHDYFNDCTRGLGGPLLVFAGLWFDIHAMIFWLLSEKYKIML